LRFTFGADFVVRFFAAFLTATEYPSKAEIHNGIAANRTGSPKSTKEGLNKLHF
jgi:hypothetical protein